MKSAQSPGILNGSEGTPQRVGGAKLRPGSLSLP